MSDAKERTFVCAECGGTFEQELDDEELARAELARDYPDFTVDDCSVLCDDCYRQYKAWEASTDG
ncbi:MAG: hypothetical protein ACJ8AK_03125 [Gemmatimonadaceae bacterium]